MFFVKLFLLFLLFFPNLNAEDELNYDKQSIEAIQKLGFSLKASVKLAMEEAGPIGAIEYCNLAALDITEEISDSLNLNINRTSLKTRNEKNNPDEWEKKYLLKFNEEYLSGMDIKKLFYYEVIKNDDNSKIFRFIKPIPTGKVCLKCHGSKIEEGLAFKIKELYPNDRAIGFKLGEIRGAFSVTIDLD